MIISNKAKGNAVVLLIVIIALVAMGAFFLLAQDKTTDLNFNALTTKKYQEAKTVLEPIFADENGFESFKKDIVRDKVRLYLDYIYQRLEPVINNEAEKAKYAQEIEHCLQNRKLSAEELISVKKFVYETTEEKDFTDKKLDKEFFNQHKNIYIMKVYENLNSVLSK
ncbi:hypothetical protein [Candidatus Uabimicrobium sp. HlEnr_7]|uniref:hypothetical protein n=1 Tax=Candidatus Uabimicrobium helgolandensis TaxID=3095367 RepID=UPI0035564E25